MVAWRNVTLARAVEAKGRDKVSEAVDEKNALDAGAVVEETDKRAGDEHAALHSNENGGVGAGELARRYNFLHEGVDGGPVHGGASAGDQRHGIEMPELQMAVPRDVRSGQNEAAANQIQR